jgi:hypothetical protein
MSNLKSWTWRSVAAATVASGGLLVSPSVIAEEPTTTLTFTKDIAPIFQAKCEACHRANSIAPMSLTTYAETRPFANSIKARVASRQMPPWHLDKHIGIQEYKNDRSLTDQQIDSIVRWVNAGSPQGDPKDMPPAVKWPNEQGWNYAARFGQAEPDLIIRSTPWTQKAGAQDAWWKPVVDTGLTEPRWVRAIEVRPSTVKGRKIVHHALAYLQQTEPPDPNSPSTGVMFGAGGLFMEWAVGKEGELMRPNSGKLMMPGAKITWDIHYSNGGEDVTDVVELGIYFYPKGQEPKYRQQLGFYGTDREANGGIDLAPNAITMNEGFFAMRQAGRVESFQPHMHLRGKAMSLEAILPTGQKQVLTYVPNFQFQWMNTYVYADNSAPLLPKGTILHITSWHDNTSANKNNPDPDQWVGFGDRTVDEMSHAWINITYMSDEDFSAEVAARKEATSKNAQQQ